MTGNGEFSRNDALQLKVNQEENVKDGNICELQKRRTLPEQLFFF